MHENNILKCTLNSLFIAIALILGFAAKIPIFLFLPFIKLDFSDIPIYLSTLVLGTPSGFICIIVSLLLRTMFFSSAGFFGFLIRITSVIQILALGLAHKKNLKITYKFALVLISTIICSVFRTFISYTIWSRFLSITFLNDKIVFGVLPYNFIKLLLNTIVAILLFSYINKKKDYYILKL